MRVVVCVHSVSFAYDAFVWCAWLCPCSCVRICLHSLFVLGYTYRLLMHASYWRHNTIDGASAWCAGTIHSRRIVADPRLVSVCAVDPEASVWTAGASGGHVQYGRGGETLGVWTRLVCVCRVVGCCAVVRIARSSDIGCSLGALVVAVVKL